MLEKLLPRNVGAWDRGVRIVLGLVLLLLVFAGPRTAWGWAGAVLLLTGIVGSCPFYTLLRVRTTAARTAQPSR